MFYNDVSTQQGPLCYVEQEVIHGKVVRKGVSVT